MGYLQVNKKVENRAKELKKPKHNDVIRVTRITKTKREGNKKIEEQVYKRTNITKLMNETKKLVKQTTATEKLEEIEKYYTK